MNSLAAPTPHVLKASIESVFVGKSAVVDYALITLLSGGHLLIEDVPGVGKTTLALALAKSMGCSFQRIQLTSDLLPSDILGVSIPNPKTHEFEFRPGPIFNQVVLADELNRATPRTQGALLESMNEHQVTMDGHTHPLPSPFFVIATQNPHEHHGTFPLPESQLDRFMMRISIGYPSAEHERDILSTKSDPELIRRLASRVTLEQLQTWIDQVRQITVASVVDDYLLALVQATRNDPEIRIGISPRGAIALRKAAQARALMQNRNYVIADDLKALAVPVMAHRLVLAHEITDSSRDQAESTLRALLDRVPVPL